MKRLSIDPNMASGDTALVYGHFLSLMAGLTVLCSNSVNTIDMVNGPCSPCFREHTVICEGINIASSAIKCKIKQSACAYENLKVDDLHRTIIYVFHIVCT